MTTKMLHSGSNSICSTQPLIGNPGLKKLCLLLRNEGDKVLSGTSTFTLTTEVLAQLNSDCRRHSITESDISTSEIVANDRSFLPLTSRLRAQQEANRLKAEWRSHIQFIKDFMLSTPCLKLIRYSGTLSSPISLHRFGNLSTLNLRKVPIHMVEGLHKLRGTLVSITVYRSVDKVKDLLEFCGGDMTAPMAWPQLKFVSFMFNSVSALDDSLRLLPHIEVFDLSHNSLETCDKFLEYLGDAHQITLAYNSLSSVPSVSVTARTSLTCLVLRGNNLVNIKGMEILTALQELDLGENCINEHLLLEPLGTLMRLKKLHLDGNPIYYHKSHRLLTVSCLAKQAVSLEFVLDKKKLTLSEISKSKLKRTPYLSTLSVGRERNRMSNSDFGPSSSSGIGFETESADSVVPLKHKKKSKRKKLKPRTTVIMDLENSGEFSSGSDFTPAASPHTRILEEHLRSKREEAIKTQNEIEELRKHYGPNWLQAIQDKDIFKQKKALAVPKMEASDAEAETTDQENNSNTKFFIGSKSSNSSGGKLDGNTGLSESELDSQIKMVGLPTDDDLYLTDTRMSDTNNPIMASIARLAAGYSTDNTDNGNRPSTHFSPQPFDVHTEFTVENKLAKLAHSTYENNSISSIKYSVFSPALEASGTTDQMVKNVNSQISSNANHEKLNQNYIHEPTSAFSNSYQSSDKTAANETGYDGETYTKISSSDLKILTSTSPDKIEVITSALSPTALLEKEEVTESMFATLPLQNNEIIIMTLTALYLVEKNIRGKVTEQLELASLTDINWKIIKRTSDGTIQEKDQGENSENYVNGSAVTAGIGTLKEMINVKPADERTDRIQLDLKFDYIRKDRQSRCYIVDFVDGKIIIDHLQPFLDQREDKERAELMAAMQCLKCNKTFMKSELIQQRNQLPKSGSSKDLQCMKELLSKAALICPKCGSSLIIELESTPTPYGSTSSMGSYLDQIKIKKDAKFGKKNAKKEKDNQLKSSGMTPAKDRNVAFVVQPRMSRSEITLFKEQLSENDELVCVEDYYSADAMTSIQTCSHSPDMTSSLLGDSSSKGSKASVKKKFLRKKNLGISSEKNEPQDVDNKQRIISSEVDDSGVISDIDKPTRPISIERRLSMIDGTSSKEDENMRNSADSMSVRKSLATMENIVNSIVTEGKCLEEQESIAASPYTNLKGKSVSISTFKRSSVTRVRKTSACSVEGLKHSESSSSIAVIPVLASVTSDDTFSTMPTLSSSVPIGFSERITADQEISKHSTEKIGNALVSPLNFSICSSMVSSVYETSVNNSEKITDGNYQEFGDGDRLSCMDNADGVETTARGAIMVIGSSSSSSEDLTSIYDHPREPKSSLRKKSHSKKKSITTALEIPSSQQSGVLELPVSSQITSEMISQVLSLTNGASSLITPVSDKTTDESKAINDMSDTDEESDQIDPQFAFHHLNHRLTLYMMMSLFGSDEEFVCKLQGEVVQYIIQKSYEGILVMSSLRFYVLKITSEDHSQTPDHWLSCVEIQPIPELRYIDVGLGGQSLRLEFVTDCSSYTFITRNKDKTTQFVEMLHTNLAKYAVSQGIVSHVVVNEDVDPATLSSLDREVVSKVTPDQKLLHYCMGFIERGNQKLFPISFIITTCDICLVCTNHQWPKPRLQAPITEETVGKQFTVLERQKISNVASVEVCEATMKKIKLELFNEMEGISANWNITMASKQSAVDFINAISDPWAKEFGVEMDVVYAELTF